MHEHKTDWGPGLGMNVSLPVRSRSRQWCAPRWCFLSEAHSELLTSGMVKVLLCHTVH